MSVVKLNGNRVRINTPAFAILFSIIKLDNLHSEKKHWRTFYVNEATMNSEPHFLEIITEKDERYYFPLRSIERLTFDKDKTVFIEDRNGGTCYEYFKVANIEAIAEQLKQLTNSCFFNT